MTSFAPGQGGAAQVADHDVLRPLEGWRVVDFSTELAGPYCTRLLAAAGADVVKVEPRAGDPMRRWSATGTVPEGEDSAMFRFLNAGKRIVRRAHDDPELCALVAQALIVVESFSPAVLDIAALRRRHPGVVIVSITPFGRKGPWSDRPASDFTVDAEGGVLGVRGLPEGAPLRIGVRITEYIAGAYAATAAVAAARRALATGLGEHVDLSIAETANVAGTNLMPVRYELEGRPPVTAPARWLEAPGVEPTADGWVGLTLMSRQQFDDFLVMIERPDLVGNEDWPKLQYRFEHLDEWNAIVHPWTRRHTTAEILELASLFRIPCSPINDGESVQAFEQFVARGSLGPIPGDGLVAPYPPIRMNGQRLALRDPSTIADEPGTHGGATVQARTATDQAARTTRRPLEGIRVLDATQWFAGPVTGQLLAALGADVIHLESHVRLDGGRTTTAGVAEGAWWERGFLFHQVNVGKRSLAVDMSREEGRDAVRRVVAGCDLVIENFSPRVFDSFGLGWDAVRRLNPRVSLVRLPAFGLDGPWRDRIGFGETMEQCTGMAWITGFPDEPPRQPAGPCDPLAGAHGALAALCALQHRDRTGEGALVEVAMAETALNAAAESVVEYAAYGRLMQRAGNRTAGAAPQGLYRCRGFEQWLALTVATDADWVALKEVMGRPPWADDPALDHVDGRHGAHDAIDRELSAWAAGQDVQTVVDALVRRGVPAACVTDPRLGSLHPQFQARGLYEDVYHPVAGRIAVGAIPFRFESVDRWWASAAPMLGEHNHEVLIEVGGLDEAAVRRLEDARIIGQYPVGVGKPEPAG